MTRVEKRLLFRTCVLGALLTLAVIAADAAGVLGPLENFIYDARARRCQRFMPRPSDKVFHLDIDDSTIAGIGAWPWPRRQLAEIVDELTIASPKVVGVDVFFPQPQLREIREELRFDPVRQERLPTFVAYDNDTRFAQAVKKNGRMVIGLSFDFEPPKDRGAQWQAAVDELRANLELPSDVLHARLKARGLTTMGFAEFENTAFVSARARAVELYISEKRKQGRSDFVESQSNSVLRSIVESQLRAEESNELLRSFSRPAPPGLPSLLTVTAERPNLPVLLRAVASTGVVDFLQFGDGVVRSVPLWVRKGDRLFPQFALVLACRALDVNINDIKINPSSVELPLPGGGSKIIPVRTIHTDKYGNVGLFMDIPWFGTEDDLFAYDPEHKDYKQHLPLMAVWRICENRQAIVNANENIDAALKEGMKPVGDKEYVAYFKHVPPPDDALAREPHIERVLKELPDFVNAIKEQETMTPDPQARKEIAKDIAKFEVVLSKLPELRRQNRVRLSQIEQWRRELRENISSKAVLIGWTATGRGDHVHTSIHPSCPGNFIHGTIISGIMQMEVWRTAPRYVGHLMTLLFGIAITGLIAWLASPLKSFLIAAGLLAAYLLFNGYILFDRGNLIVGAAGPVVAAGIVWGGLTLMRFILEKIERNRIKRRFETYVDPELVNYTIEHPELVHLEGQKREMTVVFTDLGGFTTLTEKLGEGAVAILNEYMSAMVPLVRKHRGLVNKFLGDGIMFFFNAPRENPEHALCAVESVMEMQDRLVAFNQSLKDRNLPTVYMRAGIGTGDMIVGDAGPKDASDYTVLGDKVNLSARLESANKATGTLVMCNGRTAELIKDKWLLRPLGLLRVVGKTEGIMTYTPLAPHARATDAQKRIAAISEKLIDAFLNARFAECASAAEELEHEIGKNKLTKLYMELCRQYLETPPADFDGKIVLSEK